MARYSFNQNRSSTVFASRKDINASFKDLGAVCTAIRYKSIPNAMDVLDGVIERGKPVLYKRNNKYMGSRHELGGKKGRFPIKCAGIVRKVLMNAMTNARNQGLEPSLMYVVHAAANKTIIAQRGPSKGAMFVTGGPSGYVTGRRSDLEFSRVEIGVSTADEKVLHENMIKRIRAEAAIAPKVELKKPEKKAKKEEKKAKETKLEKEEKKAEKTEQRQEAKRSAQQGPSTKDGREGMQVN
jgi:ribosomal protein uL22